MSELSQDEIDALFNTPGDTGGGGSGPLSKGQLEALAEIHQIAMGAGATTLSILLNKQVSLDDLAITTLPADAKGEVVFEASVAVDVPYTAGVDVPAVFVLTQANTSVITDLMMGGDGTTPSPIDDLGLSAISEAVNQMMGMAANTLSSTFDRRVEIQLPSAHLVDVADDLKLPAAFGSDSLVVVSATLNIEGLATGKLQQLLPLKAAIGLTEQLKAKKPAAAAAPVAAAAAAQAAAVGAAPVERTVAAAPAAAMSTAAGRPAPVKEQVAAQAVAFAPLGAPAAPAGVPNGLDLILDVPLQVTVELGRTRMQIRDVLELGKGSVIELDKMAGEPVDLLVNGKLIARGEVVVIDENFGIRVTDIVSPTERISSFRNS